MKTYITILLFCITTIKCKTQTYGLTMTNVSGMYSLTCSNPSINLVVSNNFPSAATYSWAGPSALTGSNVLIGMPGNYTVTATSGTIAISMTVAIGVYAFVPVPNISPSVQSISCGSNPAQFVVVVSPQPTVSGQPQPSYTHSISTPYGAAFSSTSTSSFLYNVSGPGTYTYSIVNNLNGCIATKAVTVTAAAYPTFSLVSPQQFTLGCNSKTVAVINFSNASTNPSGGAVSYTILAPGSPTATVPGPQSSYTVNSAGVYTAVVKDNNSLCETRIPFSVIQNTAGPNVSVIVPSSILSCGLPSVQLQALSSSSQPVGYVWTFPGTPGSLPGSFITITSNSAAPTSSIVANYTITATDLNSFCMSTNVVPMYQNLYPPKAKFSPGIITCTTPTLVLTNQSTSGIPINSPFPVSQPVIGYQWFGPTPQPSAAVTTTYAASTPGTYTLVAMDMNNGCTSATFSIVDDNQDYPIISSSGIFCFNGSGFAVISPTVIPASAVQFSWISPVSGTVSGAQSGTLITNSPGIYSITVTNTSNGCSSTAQLTVDICAGLSKKVLAEDLSFFPNPTNGIFTISLIGAIMNNTMEITNVLGVVIKKQILTSEKNLIDITSQPAGVYFVRMSGNGKVTGSYRVVKE
jgi:hypothetical protein